MLAIHFDVVDGLGRGPGRAGDDAGGSPVFGAEVLAGMEIASSDEVVAVIGPKRMVSRYTDGLVEAGDGEFDADGGGVDESAGDGAAGPVRSAAHGSMASTWASPCAPTSGMSR